MSYHSVVSWFEAELSEGDETWADFGSLVFFLPPNKKSMKPNTIFMNNYNYRVAKLF